jgi:hypothetical protein
MLFAQLRTSLPAGPHDQLSGMTSYSQRPALGGGGGGIVRMMHWMLQTSANAHTAFKGMVGESR